MIKVFSDQTRYRLEDRYHLNDIIKALWNDRPQEERDRVYGNWTRNYEYTTDIARADIALLTYKWNYYVEREIESQAFEEIDHASKNGRKTVVFSNWDSPANLVHPDVLLFELGGYRSASGLYYHSGIPYTLQDYLELYCGGELLPRAWSPAPVIGFCGQASASPLRRLYRQARLQILQHRYQAGKIKWQPSPFETSSFRARVLRSFENNKLVRTNYLLREKYHAGDMSQKSEISPQKIAFVNNVLKSDYTVCVRGGGNFSIRFYETLSLGRIPIFIDTDCLLPFHDQIHYHKLFPWIEMKDISHAAEIVAEFHTRHNGEAFIELQQACRKLWEEYFTPNGFYKDLVQNIYRLI